MQYADVDSSSKCKPVALDYIHEEVFDQARRILGKTVGLGTLKRELIARDMLTFALACRW